MSSGFASFRFSVAKPDLQEIDEARHTPLSTRIQPLIEAAWLLIEKAWKS